MIKEKFLFMENCLVCGKRSCVWNISLTAEKILDQEQFSYCGKFTFFIGGKIIGFIFLKANTSVETINTVLNLERELS